MRILTLQTILTELEELGLKDIFLLLDGEDISEETVAPLVETGIPFEMCAKMDLPAITSFLLTLGYDKDALPIPLEYDPFLRLSFAQLDLPSFERKQEDGGDIKKWRG